MRDRSARARDATRAKYRREGLKPTHHKQQPGKLTEPQNNHDAKRATLRLIDEDLVADFERHLVSLRHRQATLNHYLGAARQFLDFARREGLPQVADMAREHIEMWMVSLQEETSKKTGRRLSAATLLNRHTGLRQFFIWCQEEKHVRDNPMDKVRRPKMDETDKDIVPKRDIDRLYKYLREQKRWRDLALIALLYSGGLRAGEVVALLTSQINLETQEASIPSTISKNHTFRTVHFSDECAEALRKYHRTTVREEPAYVFNGFNGKGHLRREGLYAIVRRCFEAVGVPNIGPHDLRHTLATHIAEEGKMTEPQMRIYFGWKSLKMVERYTRRAGSASTIEHVRKHRIGEID